MSGPGSVGFSQRSSPLGAWGDRAGKWTVALTVMLPVFIEVMDTSVVNVSLPHIQGSLNAGLDEVTWVLTSYLVANAIVIPITGWLASIFGRKRYLLFSLALFTVSSVLCGSAPSLEVLVLSRVVQGLAGGALQPISQAILLETFPAAEHGMAMAVFGMGVVMAPITGPVVGGWITDHWSWREIFYINLPVGIAAMCMAVLVIKDPPYLRRADSRVDRWGLLLLCVGIGCLQIVLDKGEREDWFESDWIVGMSTAAVMALALLVWVELRSEAPVVNLRLFKDRSFAVGNLIMFLGFFSLFGTLVLLPLYLQKLMGYTALWAGLVLGPGGLASFAMMPIIGGLMRRGTNPRVFLGMGLLICAVSIRLMSEFNLQAGFWEISWPRVLLGFGMGMFFVPLTAAAFAHIPRPQMGYATGIFNLLRNLGGSFGVAFTTTILTQRAQAHQSFLVEHLTPFDPQFQARSGEIMGWLMLNRPEMANQTGVLALMYQEVQRQASMLAFNDAFWMLSLVAGGVVPLVLVFRGLKRMPATSSDGSS